MSAKPLVLALASLLVAAVQASASETATSRVNLVVSSDEGCTTSEALGAAVDGVLGRDAIDPTSRSPATIRATIGRGPPGSWSARLSLEAGGKVIGTRDVVRKGATCGVLDGPLAVVTALLVDVARESIHLEVPPPATAEPQVAPPPPPRPPSRAWILRSEYAVSAMAGLLPHLAPGASFGLTVGPPGFWPLLLRLEAWPHAATASEGPRAELFAGTVDLGICPEVVRGSFAFDGCISVMLGGIHASGEGVPNPGASDSFIALARGEVGWRARVAGPVWLRSSLGLAGGHRPDDWHFVGRGGQPVLAFQPWDVAVLATFGILIDHSIRK